MYLLLPQTRSSPSSPRIDEQSGPQKMDLALNSSGSLRERGLVVDSVDPRPN